jgi:ubiquinone/menaquinone biosynthesis C-methylase UbiE
MNSNQKEIFLSGEGDSWFDRNDNLDLNIRIKEDLILNEIERLQIKPKSVLEVGCAEGWRLNVVSQRLGVQCTGFDPSSKAIAAGNALYPNVNLKVGTAEKIEMENNSVDLLILGFCLYLCDRDELFSIAKEADRVLRDKGVIIILDFYSEAPYRNSYSHKEGVYTYKMDYTKMFTWNPIYSVLSSIISSHSNEKIVYEKDERISVSTLMKSNDNAYMERPEF